MNCMYELYFIFTSRRPQLFFSEKVQEISLPAVLDMKW